jgi:hypothetical protein
MNKILVALIGFLVLPITSVFAVDHTENIATDNYVLVATDPDTVYHSSGSVGNIYELYYKYTLPSDKHITAAQFCIYTGDDIEALPYTLYNTGFLVSPTFTNANHSLNKPILATFSLRGSGCYDVPTARGDYGLTIYTPGTGNPWTWHAYVISSGVNITYDDAPTGIYTPDNTVMQAGAGLMGSMVQGYLGIIPVGVGITGGLMATLFGIGKLIGWVRGSMHG